MFALVERFIGAKMSAIGGEHALGDQVAFEALVRLTDEELKHQEMFRRLEAMTAAGMPAGYQLPAAAQRRRPRGARRFDLGRARAHLRHRAVLAGALPQQHRPRPRPRPAVEGRVPVPLARGVAARDHRRDGMAARGRQARRGSARQGGRRPDRPGRRGRRHLPAAGQGRRRLLRRRGRARVRRRSRCRRSRRRCSPPIAGSTSPAACRSRASSSCSDR